MLVARSWGSREEGRLHTGMNELRHRCLRTMGRRVIRQGRKPHGRLLTGKGRRIIRLKLVV